jgi:hypothetical protein
MTTARCRIATGYTGAFNASTSDNANRTTKQTDAKTLIRNRRLEMQLHSVNFALQQ